MEFINAWIEGLPVRWQTMWDAKEFTTQIFFWANAAIALYITAQPFMASGKDITAMNRTIIIVFGISYLLLTLFAYFSLVPTFSPYE